MTDIDQTSLEPWPTVREFQPGTTVVSVLLVREREVKPTKDGRDYVTLVLGDKTGSVDAKVWDDQPGYGPWVKAVEPGTPVKVKGTFSRHPKYGPELKVELIRQATEDEVEWDALLDGPSRPVAEIEADFRAVAASVADPFLSALLDSVFSDETWDRFRLAPAAKAQHQAYRHGLLEHTLQVAQQVAAVAPLFSEVDWDLAITGALLHDIGKLDTYTPDPLAIEYTTDGKLMGEIPLSLYRVRAAIEALPDVPPALARGVLHIVASHHGQAEWGATSTPATPEAMLVHYMDNLNAKVGQWQRLRKAQPEGEEWSGYDRGLRGAAYFPAART